MTETIRILLVEDNMGDAVLLRETLRDAGEPGWFDLSHVTRLEEGLVQMTTSRFDVVLLDAPCSATGTLRKSPEIKWRLEEKDLAAFARLQRELLESARALANRYVVYSTCSLEPGRSVTVRRTILPSHW